MTTISGSVDRIVFRNADSGFCVARFQLLEARQGATTIIGTMPAIRPGEMLRLEGEWQIHPVHGRNFRVEHFEGEMPTTTEGIERYLSSGAVRGIGPITAMRIVETFGERAMEVIENEPELLRQVPGVSSKRLDVITESWAEQKRVRELSMFLQEHGLSVALAQRMYDAYGDEAAEVIRGDPYRLAHDIHGVGFRTADALAARLGVPKHSPSRYVAGLRFTLSRATEDGHVFLSRGDVLARAGKLLQAPISDLEPALLELVRRKDAVLDGNDVYLAPFYTAEAGAARMLLEIVSTPSALTLDRNLNATDLVRQAGETQGLQLAGKQVEAAELALREKVTVLTGGPGTGKTSTLRTVITALEAADVTFCLCAPTGRAAKRVAETTGRPASTIHRLLEFQPALGIFGYDRTRSLPYDFIIVDEVSMLDTLLFYHLLKAVPRESHLLVVGDVDQLPAVGPGNVLRDLIESHAVPTVTLTELFRQARGSRIIVAAHAVNHGQVPDMKSTPDSDFFFVRADTDEDVVIAIKRLLTERIPARFGLDPIEDVQVMSPMHGGSAGVTNLNAELQRLLNPPGSDVAEITRGGRTLRSGDKVMHIRNNYDKDVYNGDVGRIVHVDPAENVITVAYPALAGTITTQYDAQDLEEIVLAYAASVHKSQGSEFPAVIMPLVTGHFMMLQRNLLYTAITRARQLCVLVGSARALSIAAQTDHRQRRNTRLGQRLRVPDEVLQLELV
ncbi:MAG: ATP-dependent RecD-like DNA helicase [Chloroflexota bacterium]